MKIVSVTMARNEADVIETFVRHHLQIVDAMIIIDHLSIDKTPEILASIKAEGAPIDIVKEMRQELVQSEVTTFHMKRAAQELEADWVLLLDTDEFLISNENTNVRPVFEELSLGEGYRVPWRSYVPRPDDQLEEQLLFERIQYRRAEELEPRYKVIVPGVLAAKKNTVVRVGNHGIRYGKKKKQGKVAEHLHLAHFPVRSVEQITDKVLIGWPARLAGSEQKGKSRNFHLRELFEKLRNNSPITGEHLMALALDYALSENLKGTPQKLVKDRVVSPQGDLKLKYHARSDVNLVSALADLVEDLALKLAAEREMSIWKRIWRF